MEEELKDNSLAKDLKKINNQLDKILKKEKDLVELRLNESISMDISGQVLADFVDDLSDELLKILNDLNEDKSSFEKMGISFEEKAFYDILVKVRDQQEFEYADDKCV